MNNTVGFEHSIVCECDECYVPIMHVPQLIRQCRYGYDPKFLFDNKSTCEDKLRELCLQKELPGWIKHYMPEDNFAAMMDWRMKTLHEEWRLQELTLMFGAIREKMGGKYMFDANVLTFISTFLDHNTCDKSCCGCVSDSESDFESCED